MGEGVSIIIIVTEHSLGNHTTLMHSHTIRNIVRRHEVARGTRRSGRNNISVGEDVDWDGWRGRDSRPGRGSARRRRRRAQSRVNLLKQFCQTKSKNTLKAHVETAVDTRRSRQKQSGVGRHMNKKIISREKHVRVIKRRKDESSAPRCIVKASTVLFKVVKRKTKAIGYHAKTQQKLGKDLRLEPAFSEDDMRQIGYRTFAELPKRDGKIRDAHPILDGRTGNAKEKAHGKRKR